MTRRKWLLIKALESKTTLGEALELAKQAEAFLNLDDLQVPEHKKNGSAQPTTEDNNVLV